MTRARQSQSRLISMRGGCQRCTAKWDGKNALALAAKHHDQTRHPTWAEQTTRTEYGVGTLAKKSDQPRML
jgi:hypothetical protein